MKVPGFIARHWPGSSREQRGRARHSGARRRLVEQIESEARSFLCGWPGMPPDPRVLEAIGRVPREVFVPVVEAAFAYADQALPIGHGQTISQPTVVAYMTNLLAPEPGHTVLEIGTGSGYQAAVLAELVHALYTVEVIPALEAAARMRLRALGYDNVSVRLGDGRDGWPEHAPYDAIIVTAATPKIPAPLIDQLREGGRLVIPLGPIGGVQQVTIVEKHPGGRLDQRRLMAVRFVPLTQHPRPRPAPSGQ